MPVYVNGVNPVRNVVPLLDLMVVYNPDMVLPDKSTDLTVRAYCVVVVEPVLKYALAVKSWFSVIVLVLLVDPSPQWSNVR